MNSVYLFAGGSAVSTGAAELRVWDGINWPTGGLPKHLIAVVAVPLVSILVPKMDWFLQVPVVETTVSVPSIDWHATIAPMDSIYIVPGRA